VSGLAPEGIGALTPPHQPVEGLTHTFGIEESAYHSGMPELVIMTSNGVLLKVRYLSMLDE
jgi:hypothetical protein